MRILVMGDLMGRAWDQGRETMSLGARRPIRIDVDTFDTVMARLAPRLHLSATGPDGPPASIEFPDLEAFHPDVLYDRLEAFEELRTLRRRLLDPHTFDEAAAVLRSRLSLVPPAAATPSDAGATPEVPETDAATLARLLGEGAPPPRTSAAAGTVEGLVRRIAAPHIVADTPQQDVYVKWMDAAATQRMRAILHHPGFQALESIWRSIHGLVAGLETGERLEIALLDVTREELLADLDAARGAPDRTELFRWVHDEGAGAPDGYPWSLLVAAFGFGARTEDLRLLTMLTVSAARAGGPLLASADPSLLGCRSLVETPDPQDWAGLDAESERRWQALRQSAVTPWVGLALPRVLLRLPYGEETDPCERFAFDELGEERAHDAYLWGNPAFACARLIGQTFLDRGWAMQPGDEQELGDLPAHAFLEAGEARLQACAEVYLSERAAVAMLDRGLMPVLSYRHRNVVRIARFQSVAMPAQPLAGPWA